MKDLNLEQQLIFCEKYSINPGELLLLEILLLAQDGDEPEIVILLLEYALEVILENYYQDCVMQE